MHLAPSLVTGRRWKMKFLETEPMTPSWAASSIHAIPELINWFLGILLLRIVEERFGIPIKTLWKSLFQQPLPLTSNQLFYFLHIGLFQLKPDALLHATGSFTGISPCYMNHSMMTLRLDYSKCTLRHVRCFGKTKHQQSLRIEPRAPGFTCHNTFCTNCTVHIEDHEGLTLSDDQARNPGFDSHQLPAFYFPLFIPQTSNISLFPAEVRCSKYAR